MGFPYRHMYENDKSVAGYAGPITLHENLLHNSVSGVIDAKDSRLLIRKSLERIFGSSPGDRVMRPTFGSTLRSLLFEPIDNFLLSDIKQLVYDTIGRQEPRIIVSDVEVDADADNSIVSISLRFRYKNSGIDDKFDFYAK